MKILCLFEHVDRAGAGPNGIFARVDNGLIIHTLSMQEVNLLRELNPTAPTFKVSTAVYNSLVSQAKALGALNI